MSRTAATAAWTAVLLLLPILTGCGGSAFHDHFEAGEWDAAARAYEADPTLATEPEALYRAALLHAVPTSPVYAPEVALEELRELRARHPTSRHAERSEHLIAIVEELSRLRSEAAEREAVADSLRMAVRTLREESLRSGAELERTEERLELILSLAGRLEEELAEREARLRSLEEELEQLKAIDLGPAVSTDTADGTRGDTAGTSPGGSGTPRR